MPIGVLPSDTCPLEFGQFTKFNKHGQLILKFLWQLVQIYLKLLQILGTLLVKHVTDKAKKYFLSYLKRKFTPMESISKEDLRVLLEEYGIDGLAKLINEYSGTTTGSPTVTTSGSDTIIKFTGSGTYVT